jgi:PAS domain S-box-containing protein
VKNRRRRPRASALSLRGKLLVITLSVLTIGGAAGVGLALASYRSSMLEAARSANDALAGTIAEYGAGPLVFDDAEGARDILGKLAGNPEVVRATLYAQSGTELARYEKRLPPGRSPERATLVADMPVSHKGASVGHLVLESSTTSVERRIEVMARRFVIGGLLLIFVCALLSLSLQRSITGPLARLAAAMTRVGQRGELGERLEFGGDDEIGVLYGRFNDMLAQLEQRGKERTETQLWLRALVESLPDLVYVFDEQGRVVEILGVATPADDAAAGKAVRDLVPEGPAGLLLGAIAETLEKGAPVRVEYELDDGERFFEAVLTPVEAAVQAAGSRRVLAVARDVTERRRLENQLFRAQKMEAVGQLAGGVAHDFNNLLAGIMGFAEVMALKESNPATIEGLSRILDICERAGELVRQLLAFSRKAPAARRPVDVNEVLGRVREILRRTLDPRIEVTDARATELCTVEADPSQLESAVLNLAVNARDAMPEGGTITLSSRVVALDELAISTLDRPLPPGDYVQISVKDTGFGIPAELLPRIFEPFFTTKEAGKGTGLGLAAVYGTVAAHHGSVEVRSEPGKGSEFRILLPRATSQALPTTKSEPPRGTGRLVLVDDEAAVRVTAAELLQALGYSVEAFERPRDAIAWFEAHHAAVDGVVVDMVMPQMSGAELIRRLRQISPGVRVLVSSGHLGVDDADSALAGVPIVHKPFSLNQLATAVQRLLASPKESPSVRA